MTPADAFNILLRVGSLSGLAAFIWQLAKAWWDERARLQVVTTLGPGETLNLRLTYRPRSRHQGLWAVVRAVRPAGLRLSAVEQAGAREDLPAKIHRLAKAFETEPWADLRLRRQSNGPEDLCGIL